MTRLIFFKVSEKQLCASTDLQTTADKNSKKAQPSFSESFSTELEWRPPSV